MISTPRSLSAGLRTLLHSPFLPLGVAALFASCSSDSTGDAARTRRIRTTAPVSPAISPHMPAGGSGSFGNPTQPGTAQAGSPGAGSPAPRSDCTGGQYLGKYTCTLEVLGFPSTLEGHVSFLLEVDETIVPGTCDLEFCPDLVIAEGSGTLFGLAGDTGWGFEGELDGGLDCGTGDFQAIIPNGIYGLAGSTDPVDPNALLTVAEPALGAFNGTFWGMHDNGPPKRIEGEWKLADAAGLASCTGPFMVELQP